jgi:hypothetical protein
MEYEFENYLEFIDDIGTRFILLNSREQYDYKFITPEGETDYCNRQQLIDWNIKVVTHIK